MTTIATSKLRAPHEPRSDQPQVGAAGFGECEVKHHITWLDRIDHVVKGQAFGVCSGCRAKNEAAQ